MRKAMLREEMGEGDGEVVDEPRTAASAATATAGARAEPVPPTPMRSRRRRCARHAARWCRRSSPASRGERIDAEAIERRSATRRDGAQPIPENKIHPGHSVYSHPDGDERSAPSCAARCSSASTTRRAWRSRRSKFTRDTCTEVERVELNKLTARRLSRHRAQRRRDGDVARRAADRRQRQADATDHRGAADVARAGAVHVDAGSAELPAAAERRAEYGSGLMAALTDADRKAIWQEFMSELSSAREPGAQPLTRTMSRRRSMRSTSG